MQSRYAARRRHPVRTGRCLPLLLLLVWSGSAGAQTRHPHRSAVRAYAGFDKNHYPGDDLLDALHKTFAFTGYWLNNAPGAATDDWVGKRRLLRQQGFGFVVLFNGRYDADLKGQDAAALGRADAAAAIVAATREGFPIRTILFLDQEEGGHLMPEQAAYLYTWIDAVNSSAYRAGVYCSGIPVGSLATAVITAAEIAAHYRPSLAGRHTPAPALWVANDQCPPAPGCSIPTSLPPPSASGIAQAAVWQYALSPRRPEYTARCAATYAADNACYAPDLPASFKTLIDLDIATSPDPSHGR